MSLFRGALYLFETEIRRCMGNIFIVLGFIAFSLILCAPIYMNILEAYHPTLSTQIHFLSDYMFILTFGSIGVILTFIYGGGFKKDILADRLAYYRSLPISSQQIVLSKILSSLIGLFIGFILFFTGILVGFLMFSDFTLASLSVTYLVHIIFLYGLMTLINNMFVAVDLGLSYKTYTILSFVFIAVVLIISGAVSVTSDNTSSLLIMSYKFSEENPILAIIISIVLTVASTLVTFKLTTKRLKNRNLG